MPGDPAEIADVGHLVLVPEHGYIGEAAVRQRIIGEGRLGDYAPTAGVG